MIFLPCFFCHIFMFDCVFNKLTVSYKFISAAFIFHHFGILSAGKFWPTEIGLTLHFQSDTFPWNSLTFRTCLFNLQFLSTVHRSQCPENNPTEKENKQRKIRRKNQNQMNMSLTALSDAVCLGDQTATAQAKQDIIILCTKFYVKCIKIKSKPKTKQK